MSQFLLENWIWIVVALVSGTALAWPSITRRGGSGSISTQQAVQLINRERAVLVDVCEPDEFKAGHAAGSRNVPLGTLESTKDLPGNKTLPLVVVCATGARSVRAAGVLRKLGHQQVHVLGGGLGAWREANLPIEKTG